MLNALDLFSGIAGNSLGLEGLVRTVAYCEIDRHAQSVLLSRMSTGDITRAPICTDITKLDGSELKRFIDIIVGGFPCQDISSAGKEVGLGGKRSGLFYEVIRLAKEIQPAFLFLENVSNIRTKGMDRVIEELTQAGYDCRWLFISASDVGAPHKRERWFCLAHSKEFSSRREVRDLHCSNETTQGPKNEHQNKTGESISAGWWTSEPDVVRVANEVPQRMDRLKRLGNAVVPQQARQAFEILMGINK